MTEAIRAFQQSVERLWTGFVAQLPYVLIGIVVFVLFYVVSRVIGGFVSRAAVRTRMHRNLATLLSRIVSLLVFLLGVLVAAVIMVPTFKPVDLVAGLGIGSVAIGFAFKDILQNFFAGMLILWRHPFEVGDEIKSGDYEGTVENISTRATRIRTPEGERVLLPNGELLAQAITVRNSHERRRIKFTVNIGYSESIERARGVILDALRACEGVLNEPEPWVYVSELGTMVTFTVYFWILPERTARLRMLDAASSAVKDALDAAGIEMTTPQTVQLLSPEG